MKIRAYSDVHNEFIRGKEWKPLPLEGDDETVLVLAGDVDVGKHLVKLVDEMADRFLAVVYVLGNHEYYGGNIDKRYIFESEKENAHLLDNGTVTIGDTEFVGCTLWTDISGNDPFAVWNAKNCMSDFHKIRQQIPVDTAGNTRPTLPSDEFLGAVGYRYPKLTAARWLFENRESRLFLQATIKADKKQVVVTHHAPDFACAEGNPDAGNGFDVYYYNRGLQEQICDANLWIFGHTHHKFDQELGGTRVYSNPRGYAMHLVEEFDESEVIEL